MNTFYAAVWLDHHEAKIFHVALDSAGELTVRAPEHHVHRHPKGPTAEPNHPEDVRHFFRDITSALQGAQAILIGGPSTAKVQYRGYVHEHDPALEKRIVKIETVDHPTDAQFVAHARRHFDLSLPRS